ncbi:MAG: hypothetical protein FWG71_07100 [Synergistaceae bacterium]|nr:hypothetical protein [Synergistaceae bacterium]
MFEFSKKTNLIERRVREYILNDIPSPELYREFFSYDGIPKVAFNHRLVPINMPDEIWITDTTFRDGQQSITPYTTDQIERIFDYIHRLSGPKGIIRQSEFFLYSQKDRDAVCRCLEKGYEFPEITSWIRASKKDFELVKEIGLKESGILVSCSDYHVFLKMKMTRKQAVEHYISIVRECIENGVKPRCHLEDITRADLYGFVVPFAMELMKLMDETGVPVKVRACDTMGYGLTYPGSSLPRCVQGIIHGLNQHAGVPSELIEWHGHNDFYRAVSNASYAWLYGASAVNCSVFGIGERTGNTPLEAMVFEYAQFRGTLDGMDTTVITELAEYYEKELGFEIPPMTPFVGRNFNVTRAGIHADGLLKNEEIYNIFDTTKFLNRSPKISVSNTSGTSGIAHWLNSFYNLSEEDAYNKGNPIVEKLKEWVDRQYDDGRVTTICDEELQAAFEGFMKEGTP